MVRSSDSFGKRALVAASQYLARNPAEVSRALMDAAGFRLAVPLDAVRFLLREAESKGKIRNPIVVDAPPGLRVTATVDVMNQPLRAQAVLAIDRIQVSADSFLIDILLDDISLDLQGDELSPLAALLKSGALDLKKPGELLRYLPLPKMITGARDNRVSIDLLKHPKLAKNEAFKKALQLAAPLLVPVALKAQDDRLRLSFKALPVGLSPAAQVVSEQLIRPGLKRVRAFLPGF